MKLRQIMQGRRAIKRDVRFRLMTAAAVQPGRAPLEAAPDDILVGVRLLSGEETAEVYEKAGAAARAKGVEKWDEEHPICSLYVMAHTVLLATVSVPQDPSEPLPETIEPFFDSLEDVLKNDLVGRDNIVYLHDAYESWAEQAGIRSNSLTPEELVGVVLKEVDLPENQQSPLELMGHALLVSSLRFMARLSFDLLTDKSQPGTPTGSSSASGKSPSVSG